MVEALTVNDILRLVNIFLGFLLALLGVRYMRFFSQLSVWWRRLLLLAFIFILEEVVAFVGFEFFAIVLKTVFLGYFIYFLSYITTVVKEIDSAKSEMALLKERLSEIKAKEEEG
ncbi:MAG: hypothetical protein D6733_00485 [Methanobacteriota archaeon]|nr:MAG: hypothetical protein D6733_00485 [Euryarchaeota archaeon]